MTQPMRSHRPIVASFERIHSLAEPDALSELVGPIQRVHSEPLTTPTGGVAAFDWTCVGVGPAAMDLGAFRPDDWDCWVARLTEWSAR